MCGGGLLACVCRFRVVSCDSDAIDPTVASLQWDSHSSCVSTHLDESVDPDHPSHDHSRT